MKKGLLLLILMGLGFTNVNAQKFKFGAKAGVNISTIKGDNEDAYGNVTSVNIGFQGELPISEKFSFQPEMLFSGQGFIVREKPLYLTHFKFSFNWQILRYPRI